jgi:hypothetical protein
MQARFQKLKKTTDVKILCDHMRSFNEKAAEPKKNDEQAVLK